MRDLVAQRAPELLEQVTELVGEDPFARVEENTRFAQPAIFCASVVGWDALDLHPSRRRRPLARRAGRARRRRRAQARRRARARRPARQPDGRGPQRLDARARRRDASRTRARSPTQAASPSPTTTRPARSSSPARIDALDKTEEVATERKTRVIRLDVAGAFHSPAMEPARRAVPRRAGRGRDLTSPSFTVFSGASAAPFTGRPRGARRRPDQARALAGDRHRHARGRSALLRGGRPRQGARPDGEAHPQGRSVRDPRRRTCPCLAPRSRRSCTRSPATRRATAAAPAPPRTATILGLGHYLPTEIVPNGAHRRAHRRRRPLDRQAHGHPLPPPRRGQRGHRPTWPCSPPAARCRTRASTPPISTT